MAYIYQPFVGYGSSGEAVLACKFVYYVSMEPSFFTISFLYEIVPDSLQVHLSAEIEMITDDICFARNIRRVGTDESPLLPELKLIKKNDRWVHSEEAKESNISKAIGEAIDRQTQIRKDRDTKKR